MSDSGGLRPGGNVSVAGPTFFEDSNPHEDAVHMPKKDA